MKSFSTFAILMATAGTSQAQLLIDVVGTPGSGSTTWTFSGNGVVSVPGGATIGMLRTNTDGTLFRPDDTGQFSFDLDTILNPAIQDQVFALTGSATVTVGGRSEFITGIFLDDDGGGDDLGIRVANELSYLEGDTSSWSGSGVVGVDINNFNISGNPWSINGTEGQAMYLADEIMVTFRVPAPGSVAAIGFSVIAFARRRR